MGEDIASFRCVRRVRAALLPIAVVGDIQSFASLMGEPSVYRYGDWIC